METYKSKMKTISLKMNDSEFNKVKITSSKDAATVIRQYYHDDIEIYESFFILLLNRANNTIGYAKISQGGCVGTVIDVKIIAKYAVDTMANGVILAHNHPSGTLQPSDQDNRITNKIKDALKLFDVTVLDHVILAVDGYFSYADEGIL